MSTVRQYRFDVDTKRYLNRVNTFRSLSGLPNINKDDSVDIDNFIIGLKDLNIYKECLFYLFGSKHNIGAGNKAIGIGGYAKDINLVNNPLWSTDYIFCNSSTKYLVTPVLDINSYNLPNFNCCVFKNDFQESGGKIITCMNDSSNRVVTNLSQSFISSGGLWRIGGDMHTGLANRGSLLSNFFYSLSSVGFTSIGSSYISNQCFRLDNSTLITPTFTSPYDFAQRNLRLSYNALPQGTQGSNNGYYYIGGSVLSQKVTPLLLSGVYNLIKATVGKNLALP